MSVSFGIEFEFDILKPNGTIIRHQYPDGYITNGFWDYQEDSTTAVEIRSPIFTNISRAVDSIKDQFTYWISEMNGCVPFPFNTQGRSLGQHVHIGLRNYSLYYEEKLAIAKAVVPIYPFLACMHAQPIPSFRGLNSSYCKPIYNYPNVISDDHYCEISNSHHGTVEFRLFDANIPQATLTNIFFLQNIASHTLEKNYDNNNIDLGKYRDERALGLKYGLKALNVAEKLQYIRNILGNIEIPEYPYFIREILFSVCGLGLNVYELFNLIRPSRYLYFKNMFECPEKYIENIERSLVESRRTNNITNLLNKIKEGAKRVSNLDDLIELSKNLREINVNRITYSRSYSRKCLQENQYSIVRIYDVRGLSDYQVAERISDLLREHGDGFTRTLQPNEIIQANERFYVLVIPVNHFEEEILGCIAIRMRSGEIGYLVVDRRFRRMGIARRLLQYVIDLARSNNLPEIYATVRNGNEVMLNLARSMGFNVEKVDRDHFRITMRLNEGD